MTVTRGSIIVSFFLTSRSARDLNYVENVTASNGTFVLNFRGVELVPEAIVQDPAYPVNIQESEDELTLILVTIIPSGTILLLTLLLVTLCYRHRKNSQRFKVSQTQLSHLLLTVFLMPLTGAYLVFMERGGSLKQCQWRKCGVVSLAREARHLGGCGDMLPQKSVGF